MVGVYVFVAVRVDVAVRDAVGVLLGVEVNVWVGVFVGVRVKVGVKVFVGVRVTVAVKVLVGVRVGVEVRIGGGVGVESPSSTKRTASAPSSRLPTVSDWSCVRLVNCTYSAPLPLKVYLPT